MTRLSSSPRNAAAGTFLGRLRSDVRGNTLAIMAIALIPISALAGSAIDAARLYVVKVRLQQACDAGVLAGRKFMTASNDTTLDPTATAQANVFFNNNFTKGWMRTPVSGQPGAASFTPTKTTDQQVAGTASVRVPMTIMKMFKAADVTLNVTCEARYDVSDTDVIFVLDTTGSMACLPADSDTDCNTYVGQQVSGGKIITYNRPTNSNPKASLTAGYAGEPGYAVPEKTGSRISLLRNAVLKFYDTMAANIDPSTHVRYGIVTYTSTVNAGGAITALSPSYMVGGSGSGSTTADYDSRKVSDDYQIGSDSSFTYNSNSLVNCASKVISRNPSVALTYNVTGQATRVYQKWDSNANRCGTVNQTIGPVWTYKRSSIDVTNYVAGSTVNNPASVTGDTSTWLGCIEERDTTAGTMSFTTSNLPADLDPDLGATTDQTRWRPQWPDVTYARNNQYYFLYNNRVYGPFDNNTQYSGGQWYGPYAGGTGDDTTNGDDEMRTSWYGLADRQKTGAVSCGKPIQRLATLTRDQVKNYVNAADFVPMGGTYHDTGMIWGTRMLSPSGIFAPDASAWPGHQAPKRVIVFLTDGDMAPTTMTYGMYGIENFAQRVTGGDFANQKAYHNARFLAECAKAKASPMNVDVWTVTIDSSATTEMTQCASSSDKALFTNDTNSSNTLSTVFEKIAKQIAMLRISQ